MGHIRGEGGEGKCENERWLPDGAAGEAAVSGLGFLRRGAIVYSSLKCKAPSHGAETWGSGELETEDQDNLCLFHF